MFVLFSLIYVVHSLDYEYFALNYSTGFNAKLQLMGLNIETVEMTAIGTEKTNRAVQYGITCLDIVNGIFNVYTQTGEPATEIDVVGLNLETGEEIYHTPVHHWGEMMVCDSASGNVHQISDIGHQSWLTRVLSSDKSLKLYGYSPIATHYKSNVVFIDTGKENLWIIPSEFPLGTLKFIAIDTITQKTKWFVDNPYNLQVLRYDHKKDKVFGVGTPEDPKSNQVHVCELNYETGKSTVIGKIEGYNDVDRPLSAINYENGHFTALLKPVDQKLNDDLVFEMVTFEPETQKVLSHPKCVRYKKFDGRNNADYPPCPWSIDYYKA